MTEAKQKTSLKPNLNTKLPLITDWWQTARNFFEWVQRCDWPSYGRARLDRQQLYWQDQRILKMPAWILLCFTILPCLWSHDGECCQSKSFSLNQTTSRSWRTSRSCSQLWMN